jgi:hypothetical protein
MELGHEQARNMTSLNIRKHALHFGMASDIGAAHPTEPVCFHYFQTSRCRVRSHTLFLSFQTTGLVQTSANEDSNLSFFGTGCTIMESFVATITFDRVAAAFGVGVGLIGLRIRVVQMAEDDIDFFHILVVIVQAVAVCRIFGRTPNK